MKAGKLHLAQLHNCWCGKRGGLTEFYDVKIANQALRRTECRLHAFANRIALERKTISSLGR